jgi:hypothetical protein
MDRVLAASPLSLSANRISIMTATDKQAYIHHAFTNGDVTSIELMPPVVSDTEDPDDEIHPYGTVWINTATGDVFQTPGDGTWVLQLDAA